MHFNSIALFSALLLPIAISAAPVPDVASDEVSLFARAVHLTVVAHPAGDFGNLLNGIPPAAPSGSSQQDVNNANDKRKRWNNLEKKFNRAKTHILALLIAADVRGRLGGVQVIHTIQAQVTKNLHSSHSERTPHWTFTFSHPVCNGVCTGHAYGPSGIGKIWDAAHGEVYPGT